MKRLAKDKRSISRTRILGVERLEPREMLAGNVSAFVRGGSVFVNGDALSNEISITRSGPSSLTIAGHGGTTVNGSLGEVTFTRFTKNLTVNMRNGDNAVRFENTRGDLFKIFGDVSVDTGNGDDEVVFSDTSIWGKLTVKTGNGIDRISAAPVTGGRGVRVAKTTTIVTGNGDDTVSLESSLFQKPVDINLESGNDVLSINDSSFLKSTVLKGGGGGFDNLHITGTTQFVRRPDIVTFKFRHNSPPISLPDDPFFPRPFPDPDVNDFNGVYRGSYIGTFTPSDPLVKTFLVNGLVGFTVNEGRIGVTVPAEGRGTVDLVGSAGFGAAGGSLGDCTFGGTFVRFHVIEVVIRYGTWFCTSAEGHGSGRWNAARN